MEPRHPKDLASREVFEQLERIAASDVFRRSANLTRFLRFVVEEELNGRGGALKESVLGTEVFGRGSDYDPRNDPVVRVEARRLRSKLEEYYSSVGAADPVRIDLPKGCYVPSFSLRISAPAGAEEEPFSGDCSTVSETWRSGSTQQSRRYALLTAIACLGIGGTAAVWRHDSINEPIRFIAVIPFDNNAESNEYLSHGLTESVMNRLALVPGLRVMARTTVNRLKGDSTDLRQLGNRLGVDAILTGAVRTDQGRLIVQAELARTADGSAIWSQRYEREPGHALAIDEEIVSELASRISGNKPPPSSTTNQEAFRLYAQGRYVWNKRTEAALIRAAALFKEALSLDRRFALAWVGIADCYALRSPSQQFLPQAEQAVRNALEIDPNLAEAQAALAHSVLQRKRRWMDAEQAYRRAIARNPSYATAHHWYALLLASRKRHIEAAAEMRKAYRLDPLSPIIMTHSGLVRYFAHEFDEAVENYRSALALEPDFEEAHYELGRAYAQSGRLDQALRQFERVIKMSSIDSEAGAMLGYVYARTGRRDKAEKLVATFLPLQRQGAIPAYYLAILYAGLRDAENAEKWLAESAKLGEHYPMYVDVDPVLDGIRSDARFVKLLVQLNR